MPFTPRRVSLGAPALLKFEGPDTVRFLNGQLTQDIRKVVESGHALPACVTDHKGKLQFRVWLHAREGAVLIEAPRGLNEELEARLTRYLIADEVEVTDLSGQWQLHHLLGSAPPELPEGMFTRPAERLGGPGLDLWLPAGNIPDFLTEIPLLAGDELDALRLERGVPVWGRELVVGLLPPEAGLDATDISYTKGCYIGQEVISRIKSAGKLNRRLTRLSFDASLPVEGLQLIGPDERAAGELTSISPLAKDSRRLALAYVKRSVDSPILQTADGRHHPLELG